MICRARVNVGKTVLRLHKRLSAPFLLPRVHQAKHAQHRATKRINKSPLERDNSAEGGRVKKKGAVREGERRVREGERGE